MRTSRLALMLAACAVMAACQPPPRGAGSGKASAVAAEGLAAMRRIGEAGGFRSLGFASADEVRRAKLGAALPVFSVGLEALKAYRQGQSALPLLLQSSETLYPVMVEDRVMSSVSLTAVGRDVRLFSLGDLTAVRAVAPYWSRGKGAEFIVEIPGLNLTFLGRRQPNGRVLLVSTTGDERSGLAAGEVTPLEDVLLRLVPAAQDHDGGLS